MIVAVQEWPSCAGPMNDTTCTGRSLMLSTTTHKRVNRVFSTQQISLGVSSVAFQPFPLHPHSLAHRSHRCKMPASPSQNQLPPPLSLSIAFLFGKYHCCDCGHSFICSAPFSLCFFVLPLNHQEDEHCAKEAQDRGRCGALPRVSSHQHDATKPRLWLVI